MLVLLLCAAAAPWSQLNPAQFQQAQEKLKMTMKTMRTSQVRKLSDVSDADMCSFLTAFGAGMEACEAKDEAGCTPAAGCMANNNDENAFDSCTGDVGAILGCEKTMAEVMEMFMTVIGGAMMCPMMGAADEATCAAVESPDMPTLACSWDAAGGQCGPDVSEETATALAPLMAAAGDGGEDMGMDAILPLLGCPEEQLGALMAFMSTMQQAESGAITAADVDSPILSGMVTQTTACKALDATACAADSNCEVEEDEDGGCGFAPGGIGSLCPDAGSGGSGSDADGGDAGGGAVADTESVAAVLALATLFF